MELSQPERYCITVTSLLPLTGTLLQRHPTICGTIHSHYTYSYNFVLGGIKEEFQGISRSHLFHDYFNTTGFYSLFPWQTVDHCSWLPVETGLYLSVWSDLFAATRCLSNSDALSHSPALDVWPLLCFMYVTAHTEEDKYCTDKWDLSLKCRLKNRGRNVRCAITKGRNPGIVLRPLSWLTFGRALNIFAAAGRSWLDHCPCRIENRCLTE